MSFRARAETRDVEIATTKCRDSNPRHCRAYAGNAQRLILRRPCRLKRPRVHQHFAKKKTPASLQTFSLVGVSGFEPEASWTRTKRDTKLRHTPMNLYIIMVCKSSVKEDLREKPESIDTTGFYKIIVTQKSKKSNLYISQQEIELLVFISSNVHRDVHFLNTGGHQKPPTRQRFPNYPIGGCYTHLLGNALKKFTIYHI